MALPLTLRLVLPLPANALKVTEVMRESLPTVPGKIARATCTFPPLPVSLRASGKALPALFIDTNCSLDWSYVRVASTPSTFVPGLMRKVTLTLLPF